MHEGHGILDGTKQEMEKHHSHDHSHDHDDSQCHDHPCHGQAEKKNNIAQVVAAVIVALLVIGFLIWKFM